LVETRPRRGVFRLCSTLLAASIAFASTPVAAFEIFGVRLFGSDPAEEIDVIGDPQNYEITLNVTGEPDLETRIRSASNLWSDRDEPASGVSGLISKARGDYRRILAALYGEGRYGGAISITIDGREAADIAPDALVPNPANVVVSVDTGPLFTFGEARIVNQAPPPRDRRDEVDDPAEEGFLRGEEARSGVVLRAERLAVEAWRQQGHAKAAVSNRQVEADHPTSTLDAILTVDPGRRAVYAPVAVQGTARMDPDFLAFMTGLEPGQEYDPDDLARAGTRLARLDVFRASRFEEGDVIAPDGTLPITLIVQERLPRRFGVGGSYSTVDGLGLEAYWLHRNLFGRAERLRLDARVAGIGRTFKPEELTYRIGARFTKPGIYTPDTNFEAGIAADREVIEDVYTRTGIGAEAGLTHLLTEELSGRFFVNASHARFDYPGGVIASREFTTVGLLGALAFDNRDNPVDATSGFFLETVVEPFYEFQYGNAALRATAEGRAYVGFGEDDRVVAAARVKIGTLVGPEIAETPPDKLFLAGGGGSVRGYAFRSIGIDNGGIVEGGRSLIEGSAELRVKVTDTIGLVGFVDAGLVGESSLPDFSEQLRVGAGAGLRYHTGFGPIRLDVATPLNRRPGDPSVAFYVGIGQAF
jgi:translocation and assembly module TamA